MDYVVMIVIGMIIGGAITYFVEKANKPKSSGTFVIDLSDPMKDICRFELGESLDSMYVKKQVLFDIETHGEISSK